MVLGVSVVLATGCNESSTGDNHAEKHVDTNDLSTVQIHSQPDTSHPIDSIIDPRDGEVYLVITIGNQTWMAENLRFNASGSKINPGNPARTYGRVYAWSLAQRVCPEGWHLPSDAEWNELEMALGMPVSDTSATTWRGKHGTSMKSVTAWAEAGNGTNSSKLNIVPGGHFFEGAFNEIGFTSGYWTSTGSAEKKLAWVRFMAAPLEGVNRLESDTEKSELYCRCVKN